jgi:hypothetical protein
MTTLQRTEIKKISNEINGLISDTLADSILRNDNYSTKWVSQNSLPGLPIQELIYPEDVIPNEVLKTMDGFNTGTLIFRIFMDVLLTSQQTHSGLKVQGLQKEMINRDIIKFNKIGDLDVFDDNEQTLINIRIKSKMKDCVHLPPPEEERSLLKDAKDWAASAALKIPGMSDFRSEERVIFDKLQDYKKIWAQLLEEHKMKEKKEKEIQIELDKEKKTSPHEYLDFDYKTTLETICQKLKEIFESIFVNINTGEINSCNLIVNDDVYESLNEAKMILDKYYKKKTIHKDYVEAINILRSKSNLFCKQKIWVSSIEYGHYSDYSYDSWLCHWAKSSSVERINGLNYWQKSFFSIHWNVIFLCLISHQELFFLKAMKELTTEDEKKLYNDVKKCPPIEHDNKDYVKKLLISIPNCTDEQEEDEASSSSSDSETDAVTSKQGGIKKKKTKETKKNRRFLYIGNKKSRRSLKTSPSRAVTSDCAFSMLNGVKFMKGGKKISFWDITNKGNLVFVDENNYVTKFQIAFEHSAFNKPLHASTGSVEKKQSTRLTGCEKYYDHSDSEIEEDDTKTHKITQREADALGISMRISKYIKEKGLECAEFEDSKEDRNTYLSLISIYETLGCDSKDLKTIIEIKNGLPQIKNCISVRKNISEKIVSISEYGENIFISTKNETFDHMSNKIPFFNLKTFNGDEYKDSEIMHFEQINIGKEYYVVILNNKNPLILDLEKTTELLYLKTVKTVKNVSTRTDIDEVNSFEVNSFRIIYKNDKIYILISSNKNSKAYMKLYIYTNGRIYLDEYYILNDHDEIKSIDFLINKNNVCYFICGDNAGKMHIGLYKIDSINEGELLNHIILDIHSSGDVKAWFFNNDELICALDSEGTLSYWDVKYNRVFKTLECECIHRITGFPNKLKCNPLYKNSLSQSMIYYDDKNGRITAWNIINKDVVIPKKGIMQEGDFNHLCLADLDSDKNFTWVPDKTADNTALEKYNREEWRKMKSYNDEVNRLCGLLFLKNMDKNSIRDLYFLMIYTKKSLEQLYNAVVKNRAGNTDNEIYISSIIRHFKTSKNIKWIKLINSYIVSEVKRKEFIDYLDWSSMHDYKYIKIANNVVNNPIFRILWQIFRERGGNDINAQQALKEGERKIQDIHGNYNPYPVDVEDLKIIERLLKVPGEGGRKNTKRRSKKSKKTRKTRRSK